MSKKIAVDLGTTNTLVYVPKKGIVINEPSVVAVSLLDNSVIAVGSEAKEMLGRTPDAIKASCPLKEGVIADYKVTEAMLRYFINKICGKIRLSRPEVLVSVPAGITSTERRAVLEAARQAGAKQAYIIKEPVAAALGAGIPINAPSGNLIVDIGGGTSEVAVISLGGIVASASARVGGNRLDQSIIEMIKKKHGLAIGERTAEEIKIAIGSAVAQENEEVLEIRGRDLASGLPKTVEVSSDDVTEAFQDNLKEILRTIKLVLRETPPELSADVIDKGLIISGGGALLKNIDSLISSYTGVPCYVASEPLLCVAKGAGMVLENLDNFKKSILAGARG
ncbi:MAG: rod shape-determining protein [bacterium]